MTFPTPLARTLRKNQTDAEKTLWNRFNRKQFMGLKFRRQEPVKNYIVDFMCYEKKLIIELDGGHHNDDATQKQDEQRDDVLRSCGFLVLRFWNNQVFENIDGVLETIRNTIYPQPCPPPHGEGAEGTLT